MSRYILGLSTATAVLIAGLGGAVLAQDGTTAPAAPALPEALTALNLQDVQIREGRRGQGRMIRGDLPGGGEIRAMVDAQNNVRMVDADDAAVPQSLIEALLPQSVRGNDILSQFATIERIGGRDDRFMVSGEDADGEDLRAGFDADGQLLGFGRGDMEKRGSKQMRGHGHGQKGHGFSGKQDGRKNWGRDDKSRDDRMGMMRRSNIDTGALTEKLTGAGYSELGTPRPAGPRLTINATNPSGEAVTIEVDPAGQVIRETAR